MKIQELLNKYKDKIWEWYFVKIELSYFENDIDLHCWWQSAIYPVIKPLSDLLFSTPFLSLLEWKSDWLESRKHFCVWFVSYGCGSYNYHKINLVLLNTDKERIEYIEQFTL